MESPSRKLQGGTSFRLKDWSRYYDDGYQAYYYVHEPTGHTQWETPTGPPSETKDKISEENDRFIQPSSFDHPALYDQHGESPEHMSERVMEKTLEVNPSEEQFRFIRSSSFEQPTVYAPWGMVPEHTEKGLEPNPSEEQFKFIRSSSFEQPSRYAPWGMVPEHELEPAEKTLEVNPSEEQFRFIRSSSFEQPTRYAPWGLSPENHENNDEYYLSDEEGSRARQQRRRSVCDEHGIKWIGSEDFVERGRFMSMETAMSELDGKHGREGHLGVFSEDEGDDFYRDNVVIKRQTITYPGGKNQDYLGLARLYKLQRPYSDPNYQALCLLCKTNYAEDVFFPCEHHCVCRVCMEKENICEEKMMRKNPNGYCNCSLCASVIKLILPLEGGKEIEKYWNWVYEEKAELPKGFMKNFRHSAAVIQAVYIDDKHELKSDQHNSSFCRIS